MGFDGHSGPARSVFLSESILVSGSTDTTVISWNAANGNIIRIFSGHEETVTVVGLFEGFLYSAGEIGVVFKWNIDGGEIIRKFPLIHDTLVTSFEYRSSELFSSSIDSTVIRWDTESGEALFRYSGKNRKLRAVVAWKTFVISAGENLEINIWDASINSAEPFMVLVDHTRPINVLAVYNDFLYSGSSDNTAVQWNLKNFTLSKMFEGYPDSITSLIAGQFFLYSSGFARDIYQWDVSLGSISGNFEGHTDDVYTLKLNSIFLFSGSRDRTLRVWNAQIPAAIKVFYGKSLSDFNLL